MKNRLNLLINLLLVICAITITFFIVRKEFFAKEIIASKIENWQEYVRNIRYSGNPEANNKIIFFSNYQCIYCKKVYAILNELMNERNDLQVCYYEFPNEKSEVSFISSKAAVCGERMNKYNGIKKTLYQEQELLNVLDWENISVLAGIENKDTLRKCISDPLIEDIVFDDILSAKKLKIKYTPTLIVNGNLVEGLLPKEEIIKFINKTSQ